MAQPVRKPVCSVERLMDRCAAGFRFQFSDGTDGVCYIDALTRTPQQFLAKLEETFRDGTARGAQRWRDIMTSVPEALEQIRTNAFCDRLLSRRRTAA